MAGKVLGWLLTGLLVCAVGFFVVVYYMNSVELQQAQKEMAVLSALNQRQAGEMKKVLEGTSAIQNELDSVKGELESTKKELDSAAKELSSLKATLGKLSK
jgi:septal ring factor EnvC (AmiA/AmiB activator)